MVLFLCDKIISIYILLFDIFVKVKVLENVVSYDLVQAWRYDREM